MLFLALVTMPFSLLSHRLACAQEEVTLSALVDRTELPQNQCLVYTITVRWVGVIGDYDFQWPTSPECTNLAAVGYAASNEATTDQGTLVGAKTFSYTLQPLAAGKATVGASTLAYFRKSETSSEPRTLSTRPITVSILPPSSDGPNRSGLFIGAAVLLAGAIALSLAVVLRRRRASAPEETSSVASYEDQAIAALQEASGLRVADEFKAYYAEIALVLASYLERRWSIQCVGAATCDVIQRMHQQGQIPDSRIQDTQSVLSECDLVKFASHAPTAPEMDRVYARAVALIRECAPPPKEQRRAF